MRLGSTWITVTGMDAPSSAKTRVMPHLRPITPILISLSSFQRTDYDWPGVKNLVKSTARRVTPTGRSEPGIIPMPPTPLQGMGVGFLANPGLTTLPRLEAGEGLKGSLWAPYPGTG